MQAFKYFYNLTERIFSGILHKTKDNYDFARFPTLEKNSKFWTRFYKEKVRDNALWTLNLIFFLMYSHKFFKAYYLLCDQESKDLFIQLIAYKILGQKHIKVKNNYDWHNEKELLKATNEFYVSSSEIALKPHPEFGGLNHYQNVPTESGGVNLDCWLNGIACLAMKKQYYFSRHNITIQPALGDIVIDGGGCFGDSSVFFAKSVGPDGAVYVFDPLPTHGIVIQKNIVQNKLEKNITYLPYAIGELSNHVQPVENLDFYLNPGFRITDETNFPIITIDDFMMRYDLHRIDFIKMDIEGYELHALKGAAQTIAKFRPKLAISLYHRKEDFFAIPLWLNQITKGYRFYIDHYTMHAEETVLYAIPT